ncbi:hypothetical protein E8K88_01445 [Lampropedia aestuarii]|uniref:Uncharacterized protein n=1 Tax=Lampropedia aestuarii TaxID=2562762 RepID=A0A4V3YXP5_9BURK|nr:hypothetical protein [Lampropedia aestuarii]THJ35972.1 hypothetical protein E8K88_01445 [Lampropedia aestuarii]
MSFTRSTVGMPEDQAYLLHHFACPSCSAAGITPGTQQRCATGAALWAQYQGAYNAREHAERSAPAAQLKSTR